MKNNLLGMIEQYDRQQQWTIGKLEEEIVRLKKENLELLDLAMSATSASEKKTLQLIMAGHFDKKPEPTDR